MVRTIANELKMARDMFYLLTLVPGTEPGKVNTDLSARGENESIN